MTAIPESRDALADLFEAGLTGVQVVRGPGNSVTVRSSQMLTFEGVTFTRSGGSRVQTNRNLPFGTFQEDFTVQLVILVSLSGETDQWAADDAALGIYENAVALIEAAAVGLGITGVEEAVPTGEGSLESSATSNGRAAALAFGVEFIAWS